VEKKGTFQYLLPPVLIERLVIEFLVVSASVTLQLESILWLFRSSKHSLCDFLRIVSSSGKLSLEGCIKYVRLVLPWRVCHVGIHNTLQIEQGGVAEVQTQLLMPQT
jgi:hypothetical protein